MGEQQSQGLAGRCQATPPSSLLLPLLSHLSRNVNSEDRNVSKNFGSCPEDMICSRRAAPWPSVGSKHLCKSGTLGPLWQNESLHSDSPGRRSHFSNCHKPSHHSGHVLTHTQGTGWTNYYYHLTSKTQ